VTGKIIKKESRKKTRAQHTQTGEASPASEALFSTIFNSSPMPMVITRVKDERIIDVNAAWEKTTGFNKEETIGHSTLELNCWATLDEREKLFKAVHGSGRLRDFEHRLRKKSGEILSMLMSAELMSYEGEQYIITMGTDITERKQMEELLRINEERYQMAQVISHSGNWEYNLQTNHFWGSDEAKRLYGFDPGQAGFTTDEVENCIPERERVHQALVDLIESNKPYDLEFEIHPKNSSESKFISSIAELKQDKEGNPIVVGVIQDITQRKTAEEALQKGERQFTTVFHSNPAAIAITRVTDNRIVEINIAWEQMTGISREEAPGHTTFDLDIWINPEIREQFIRDLRERGELRDVEVKVRTKSGEPAYMLMSGQFIEFNGDECLLTMAQNITELKRMEVELRAASLYTRNLIEASLDPLVTISSGGKIMDVNKATEYVTGVSRKDLIGSDFSDYFTDPEKARKGYQQVFSEGIVKDYPLSIRNVSGHVTDVLYNASTYTNEAGEVQGVFAAARDITKRKHAEEALRESEEKYRVVIENMMDGVILGTPEGKILAANKATCDMFGKSESELIAIGRSGMIDLNDTRLLNAFEERKKLGKFRCEVNHKRNDGTVFPTEVTAVNFKDSRGNERSCVIIRDITNQKKFEEEQLKVDKLESLSLLAGGIAHDFNNVLTTILGNISLSKMLVNPEDEIFDLLGEAEAASLRAQMLTRQLLTFAKGGAPVKETASIAEIIEESAHFILHGSKSRCEFSIKDGLWHAEVDEGQISQVINNIVLNADHAMPQGGVIRIIAENMEVGETSGLPIKPGRYILISITDPGIGIAEKHLSKIFDPYFTTKQKGSGLGLATAYSIIKRHDGHISVESELGVGTTFSIYVPASDKPLPEKKEEVIILSGSGRLLVMDDDEPIRKTIGRMLSQLGYEPEFAADGAEAVQLYKMAMEAAMPFDAVILDLTIPGGMGGNDAIKELAKINPDVKAIVSSGYSNDEILSTFKEYGFKAMVPKPYEIKSLSKVLNDVLRKEE
jgi:PAS domain S-box-containing protein